LSLPLTAATIKSVGGGSTAKLDSLMVGGKLGDGEDQASSDNDTVSGASSMADDKSNGNADSADEALVLSDPELGETGSDDSGDSGLEVAGHSDVDCHGYVYDHERDDGFGCSSSSRCAAPPSVPDAPASNTSSTSTSNTSTSNTLPAGAAMKNERKRAHAHAFAHDVPARGPGRSESQVQGSTGYNTLCVDRRSKRRFTSSPLIFQQTPSQPSQPFKAKDARHGTKAITVAATGSSCSTDLATRVYYFTETSRSQVSIIGADPTCCCH